MWIIVCCAITCCAICNSDQGSHFTSPRYLERLLAKEVRVSMDGKGRALDNIFTERLHQSLGYRTPAEVYFDPTLQKQK